MLLSRVIVASAAAARSNLSSATRRIQTLSLHRRIPFLAMSRSSQCQQQQRDGEAAEPGGDRRRESTSTTTSTDDDVRSSKKALRSSISATLKALSDEEMARQSAEIARSILASPIWKNAKKVGVYLAAPRLREVDTELLVRAALGGGGAEEEAGANGGGANGGGANGGGGASSTSASSANEEKEKEKESKMKRLFVPIVGDGPQEMCLVHLDSLDGLRTVPPFGIREPSREYGDGRPREDALSAHIDALFLPGVAFDREGRRLGRGLGYYDAWAHRARRAAASRREAPAAEVEKEVEDPSAGPLLVGLAFSQQMMMPTATATGEETAGGVAVVAVPVERHDVGLDAVAVAGEGLVATSERGRRALSAL